MKHLILIGGGHSHLAVLRAFGMEAPPDTRLTLICDVTHAPYSGMLPGLIAGHYRFEDAHIDLTALADFANAEFVHGTVIGLDADAKQVQLTDGPPMPYDLLSINIGSTPATEDVPGAAEHTVPVKPISQFLSHWELLQARISAKSTPCRIVVVGGGAGGVELLLALQYRLSQDPQLHRSHYHLVTEEAELLSTYLPRIRKTFHKTFSARGIELHTEHRVNRVEANHLHCENGKTLEFDEILWVTAAGAAPWPAEAGLTVDDRGFIAIDETMQSVSCPDIFAVGDIASMTAHPHPKSGVFAVKQGPALAENLRRHLSGAPLLQHIPQSIYLSLISTGNRYAVGSRGSWTIQGRMIWHLKNWIDRRFIATYTDLPGKIKSGGRPNLAIQSRR